METTTDWFFSNTSPSSAGGEEAEFVWEISENQLVGFTNGMFDTVFAVFILPIAFIIGVFGNSSVVYVFYRVKHMRTVTNYYLVSLALADLFVLVFTVPFFWVTYATSPIKHDATRLGPIGCKIFLFVPDCAVIVSSLTVAVLTVERYMAICTPMKFKQWSKKDNAITISSIIWVTAILYKIPTLYFSTEILQPVKWPPSVNETFPEVYSYCHYCTAPYANINSCINYYKSLIIDQVLILSIIPFTVTLYGFIVHELRKLSRTAASSATNSSHRMKQQVVKMLIVTIVIFFICITPFRVMNLLYDWFSIYPPAAAADVSRLLVYINSATNPIIYNAMSDAYRKSFKEGFSCCIPHKSKAETKETIIVSTNKPNNGLILTNNSKAYLKNSTGNLL